MNLSRSRKLVLRSLALFLLFFPALVLAENTIPALAKGNDYSGYFIKMIISMLLIIGMLAAFVWYTRRFGIGVLGQKPNDNLQVISMLSLGAKERIVMIQAGEDQLVLGLTPGEITKLHTRKNTRAENFSSKLSDEMGKRTSGNQK